MAKRKSALEGVVMLQISSDFWQGKKVFLTGHTGFKGAWLALWLQHLGAKVTGYSLSSPTSPSFFDICGVEHGMRSVTGDICDASRLVKAMLESEAEVVLHLAAQSLVHEGYSAPVQTYATNVMGTVNLLEAVRHQSTAKSVVVITTDKCYENKEWHWGYRENDPMGGYDPYSSSKGCAELVAAAYRNSYFNVENYTRHGVGLASARAGNVIGGGDWAADRLIPDMVRAVAKKEPVKIRRPNAIRPWQHVLEPLAGYLMLAQHLYQSNTLASTAFNFGPRDEDAKSVINIAQHFTSAWGDGASWVQDVNHHPHEAQYLKLDCSKAKNLLSWRPHMDLNQALNYVVQWHKSHIAGNDMRQISLQQIEQFMVLCKE
jgi:CDP-glucose 4,6-dehydratase